jgi:diguanylate cyclase (GGDEF)-like protein
MIDLDWFKHVNDKHGHLAGDAVLKGIGSLLSHELRGYDTLGRFGGEEFVAILPGASEAQAVAIAERLRCAVMDANIAAMIDDALENEFVDHVTVSIGVAISPTDGSDLTELLHAADSALYAAKGNGRNQVQLARRGGGSSRETAPAVPA